MRTHNMIVRSPPLHVSQQLWGGLRRGPRATCQSRHSVTDGQIYPFNEGGVEPSRKAQSEAQRPGERPLSQGASRA
jgi:hypothetical protein